MYRFCTVLPNGKTMYHAITFYYSFPFTAKSHSIYILRMTDLCSKSSNSSVFYVTHSPFRKYLASRHGKSIWWAE
uniref:Uncharacterized protein n=1 Tax=Arundo donax TaxID=35708 RepID=A0A0A8ZKT6_ARUDO